MFQALSPRWNRPLSVFLLGNGALPALDQRVQQLGAAGAILPRFLFALASNRIDVIQKPQTLRACGRAPLRVSVMRSPWIAEQP